VKSIARGISGANILVFNTRNFEIFSNSSEHYTLSFREIIEFPFSLGKMSFY
jgi:hypothetical protein